ncbi:MFS transporter [Flaviflexus massiliensis]|uniref:MFS transporter n=1 Tax=Flaviflexus massiliensis TaxID=1522309 RepID=UPI000B1AB7A8|nr:MFS transporter [Flaviflexus massiliensis]
MTDENLLSAKDRNRVLIVLLSSLFMALIAVSIINVALPSIRIGLEASSTDLQWVLSGYSLTFGIILVAAGRSGDLFGRERLFIAGTTLFGLASLVASIAPDILVLNIARAFMGVGAGLMNPQTTGIIQQYYRGADRARAFGLMGAVVGFAVAIGPVIGGAIIGWFPDGVGWRWTMGINVPLSIISVVLAIMWLPRTPRSRGAKHDLDPVGALLLGVAVLLFMLPFMMATDNANTWWFAPAGIIIGIAWFVWEQRYRYSGRSPMVNMSLFRNGSFTLGTAMITVFFAGTTTVWVLIAQFVQNGAGESALVAGLVGLPAAIVSVFTSYIGGRLVMTHGRRLVIVGLVLNIIGLALTVWAAFAIVDGAPIWVLAFAVLPIGFGAGWITSPNQTLTLRDVPPNHGGTAGGIMQTGQRIGTAVGTAAVTGLYFSNLEAGHDIAFLWGYILIAVFMSIALIISIIDAAKESAK